MEDLIGKVHRFIVTNVGSSICLCSNDGFLLQWISLKVVEKITKEYLILTEPGIEDIRYMMDFLYSAPSNSHKVVFVHRAERILQEAANSMLKILEEPPSYCVITLTTTRFTDLLPTIRSRVKALSISVDKTAFEILRKRLINNPKADLVLKLCSNDFDVFNYLQNVEEFSLSTNFEESEFLMLFTEKELSASDKLKATLMLDDLYSKLSSFSQKELVQLYLNIMEGSKKIDLNSMVVFMCRIFQMILELKGCRDVSIFKWLDSILVNRLMNFNGPLVLLNLLILIRRSAKR
ncbi:MAG: hypothetical protein ACK4E2_03370 [Pseudothermotoga sp.]